MQGYAMSCLFNNLFLMVIFEIKNGIRDNYT
jgi:hypothetical protein